MTFDPHPPRVVRPDKAPPLLMTTAQRLEALDARRHAGRRGRALHPRDVAVGSGDVRAHRAGRVAARRRSVGGRQLSLRPRSRAATSRVLRTLGARYGFRAEKIDPVRYKDFVVSSTRIRRLVAEGRVDEAGALLGHHYFIDGTVVKGAAARPRAGISHRESRHRERAAAAGRRVRDDGGDQRRRASVGDERGPSSHLWRRRSDQDRDASARHRSRSVRRARPVVVRPAAARRAGVSRTSTPCASRSTPTAGRPAGCSVTFRYRIVMYG